MGCGEVAQGRDVGGQRVAGIAVAASNAAAASSNPSAMMAAVTAAFPGWLLVQGRGADPQRGQSPHGQRLRALALHVVARHGDDLPRPHGPPPLSHAATPPKPRPDA